MGKQTQRYPRALRHPGHTSPEAATLALIAAIAQEFPKEPGEREQAYQARLRAIGVQIVSREKMVLIRDDSKGAVND